MNSPDRIKQLWKMYVRGEDCDYSALSPEVLESWSFCRGRVDPYKEKNEAFLTEAEFAAIKANHSELISIALPVMHNLYSLVKGSGFSIHFGIVIKESINIIELIGDPDALQLSCNYNTIPGTVWREDTMGTSASVLAIRHKRPFLLTPFENWCECLHNGTNSTAPIFDPRSGEVIAGLHLMAEADKKNPHTLGMAAAAATSIQMQLAAFQLRRTAEIENQYKTLLMESISDGLIAIDENMMITHINTHALRRLGSGEISIGDNLFQILKQSFGSLDGCKDLVSIIQSKDEYTDEFINLTAPSRVIRGTLTTRNLRLPDGQFRGKIVIISDMARVNRLTSKAFGQAAHVTFNDIIGDDDEFEASLEIACHAARGDATVLLLGESGTGKDLFSQAIHNASSRHAKPYIAINCAAIPRDLLGSELFGYSEGAFTGAKRGGNPGKFELADGGTLFLDEIGEMSLEMQTVLLRVIEEKYVTRIGGQGATPADVRIIAATNKDLYSEVEKGTFRADLYYRLNVMTVSIPPLRQRKSDLRALTTYFIEKISAKLGKNDLRVSPEVMIALSLYDWPGNIRELQNVIERMIYLVKGNLIELSLLPPKIIQLYNKTGAGLEKMKLKEYDKSVNKLKEYDKSVNNNIILSCLNKNNGNITTTAKELGVSRTTIYRKIGKKHISYEDKPNNLQP